MDFVIDKEKCIHCGQCIKDCVSGIIEFSEENYPYITDENRCIKCQHCLAVCPTGALKIFNKNPEDSELANNFPTDEQLLNLIKSRRSYRHYKPENIPKDLMDKLKNMLKYPPTGCNFHKLHFSIIEDIEVMDKFRNLTNNKIKKLFTSRKFSSIINKFSKYKDAFLNGEDVIFRDCPHMIVVSSPINAPCAPEDAIINLSYFELYAQSLNIGTLWCGFAEICLKVFPDLCEYLEIPDGYKPMYVMLFGLPDIHYTRTVQPEEYQITSVNDKPIKMNFIKKLKRYFWNFIR